MLRNVGGIWFVGQQSSDRWVMRRYDLGNGHAEVVISRPIDWREVNPETAALLGEDWEALLAKRREDEAEERRQANRKRAARRAVTRVRRLIKVMGLNTLLTLTYRANQTDQALAKRHFKEFVRRVRRVLPRFRFVAAFEQQKRGAWHVHIVTDRVPALLEYQGARIKSFNVLRAVWRGVAGELGGNVDIARKARSSRQSIASLAKYVSKYMLKAFQEGDDWSNRYSASQEGAEVPEATVLEFRSATLGELIDLAYGDVCVGDTRQTMWLSRFGDTFYLAVEPAAFDTSAHSRKCS